MFFKSLLTAVLMVVSSLVNATLIFDNSSASFSSTNRAAGSSPGTLLSVSADTTINQIGVSNNLNSAGSLRFLIFNHETNQLLFDSGSKSFADDGNGFSWKLSDFFSFTLLAGVSYDIGAIANVGGRWAYDTSGFTQNSLTSISRNANFTNFASPTQRGHAAADSYLQLFTRDTIAVPEPSMIALMGLSLVGLALGRRRLRK